MTTPHRRTRKPLAILAGICMLSLVAMRKLNEFADRPFDPTNPDLR